MQAVENMPPKPMPNRHTRMFKVTVHVSRKAEAIHNRYRTRILWCRKGQNFLEFEYRKTERQASLGRFGRKPLAPEFKPEPPCDFYGRRKFSVKDYFRDADIPNESVIEFHGQGKISKTICTNCVLKMPSVFIGLGATESLGKMFHYPGIGIQGGKGLQIVSSPAPQHQAFRLEIDFRMISEHDVD